MTPAERREEMRCLIGTCAAWESLGAAASWDETAKRLFDLACEEYRASGAAVAEAERVNRSERGMDGR